MEIREALRRLGPEARLDPARLQEQLAEVVKEQGEAIFAQLSEEARQRLRKAGLRISEQTARLTRIRQAIAYGAACSSPNIAADAPQEDHVFNFKLLSPSVISRLLISRISDTLLFVRRQPIVCITDLI
jgi:hypothetical protein